MNCLKKEVCFPKRYHFFLRFFGDKNQRITPAKNYGLQMISGL